MLVDWHASHLIWFAPVIFCSLSTLKILFKILSTSLSPANLLFVVGVLIRNHIELGIHCLMTTIIFACVEVVFLVASFNLSSLFLDSSLLLGSTYSCGPSCMALDD